MTRIVLNRKRARDPMAVAQEIITDLRFQNARLTRMNTAFTRVATVAFPRPHTWFENLMAKNLGCLVARHHWVQIHPDVDNFLREICSYCSKIRIGDYNGDAEDGLPTGSRVVGSVDARLVALGVPAPAWTVPRRRGPSSYPEHAPNGPAPAAPEPGNPDHYDDDGDLIGWRAAVTPPASSRMLSWGRMGSRLVRGEVGP